jgi:hypothetical protein
MRGIMRQIPVPIVILGGAVCVCFLLAAEIAVCEAFPLNMGRIDEEKLGKQKEAQKMLEDLNLKLSMDSEDVVRIGSGYTVEVGETVEGDVVIIGGGLTVKGIIEGDAAVIGGSMYLEAGSVIEGDAAVIGGIIQIEDGAVVEGDVVENPEMYMPIPEHMTDIREIETPEVHLDHEGEIVKFGSDIHVGKDDYINGDVVAIGGDITIDGHVTGDVVTTAGDIAIGSAAHVEGDVVATFGKVTLAPGATTDGEVTEISMGGIRTVPHVTMGEKGVMGDKVTYLITLYEPNARDVRLTGTFIDWDEDGIEMKRDDEGTWKTWISLGPGTHMYKFIVDGNWMADPEMEERVPDGMGGYATPIVVKTKPAKGEKTTTVIFSLDRPEAEDIRITGTWNNWDSEGIRLRREDDGVWKIKVPFPPGMHAYKFYVDGRWMPDPDEPDKLITDRDGDEMTSVVIKPRDGRVLIHFLHDRPDVRDMRVTGTWNDWDPRGIPMYQNEDGVWFTYIPLYPGNYKYKFYLDGEWMPDPDVDEVVPDGRGGYATEFTVKPPKKIKSVTVQMGGELGDTGLSFSPLFDYNRVDGVYIGACFEYGSKHFPEPNFYVEGGYSKKRDRGLYEFKAEQPLYAPLNFWVGGSLYDLTETNDKEIITDVENVLVASLFRFDYRDYFDLRGIAGFARIEPIAHNTFTITYRGDEYRPLRRKAKTTIFNFGKPFPTNPRNSYQICFDPETDNQQICDKIMIRALELTYRLDTRDCHDSPTLGFLIHLSGEWARKAWGGDLEYSRYVADVRRYHRFSPKQHVGLRLKAGMMSIPENAVCGCVPKPHYFFPKQFYAGGIGTLPGYGYKEARGTHLLLANFEYNYLLKDNFGIVFFSDAGDAKGEGAALRGEWDSGDVWKEMKIKFDAGVALRVESTCDNILTLGVAQRLDDFDRGPIVTVRASRMF